MIVKPSEEATALNVVSVVEPDGTYMVRFAPDFRLTNDEQEETLEEAI
jgi:hypothetical protein